MNNQPRPLHCRHGVTLMEVIFSIGVILSGLVGLAALIPIAVDNASATLELDRGISESVSAAANAVARDINSAEEIVIYDKPLQGSTGAAIPRFGYNPQNNVQSLAQILNSGATLGTINSPGYRHSNSVQGIATGICIDPLGMPNLNLDGGYVANATTTGPNVFQAPTADDSAYDASRFPYYSERHNVLSPPNDAVGNVVNGNAWPMSPRMYRATLLSSSVDPSVTVYRQPQLINPMAADRFFTSSGGVVSIGGSHKDDPDSLQTDSSVLSNIGLVDTGLVRSSRYSWMVTLSPPLFGGDLFRQSVVIIKDRRPEVPQRPNDVLALRKTFYGVEDADENPTSERLTWVGDWTGFSSASGGGDIQIFGSQSVDDEVVVGQWVMLSRQPHQVIGGNFQPVGPAVHRWYKVVRADKPVLVGDVAGVAGWPHGNPAVWSRWLTLIGSDWSFRNGGLQHAAPASDTAIDDTFCTIVAGVVSVIESDIRLEP